MEECTFCQFVTDYASLFKRNSTFSDASTFYDEFTVGKKIGSGAFAVVKQCIRKEDGNIFAVKIINKRGLSEPELAALHDEISILESLEHPNILHLQCKFEDVKNHYLVTEFIAGGELFERIEKKHTYSEKETADTCKILFQALKHCHDRNIVHRDIKPENLLLISDTSDTDIKLADFGFATYVDGQNLTTLCGTPSYVAAEIIRKKPYGVKVDMWSMGVIVYTLLGGYLPFDDNDLLKLFKKIRRGKYDFHEEYWKDVSPDAKDLVAKLLQVDPYKRLSAEEALQHKWVLEEEGVLKCRRLSCQVRLKMFNAKRKFRAAVRAVTVASRLSALSKRIIDEAENDSFTSINETFDDPEDNSKNNSLHDANNEKVEKGQ